MKTYQCQTCFTWRFVSQQTGKYDKCGRCVRKEKEGRMTC